MRERSLCVGESPAVRRHCGAGRRRRRHVASRASAGVAPWMRVAIAVAAVLAVVGLLAVGSRGEVADGDGRGVGTAEGAYCDRGLDAAEGRSMGEAGFGVGPALHPAPQQGECLGGKAGADGLRCATRFEERRPWWRAATVASDGAWACERSGWHASSAVKSWDPAHEGDAALLVSRAATPWAGVPSPPEAERSEACVSVRETA